jgi:hypothetical protein
LNFKPRSFSEFSLKIHFESEEVSMDTIGPLIKTFKNVFYFKKKYLGKVLFGSKEV